MGNKEKNQELTDLESQIQRSRLLLELRQLELEHKKLDLEFQLVEARMTTSPPSGADTNGAQTNKAPQAGKAGASNAEDDGNDDAPYSADTPS